MEEFQEADILWPEPPDSSYNSDHRQNGHADDAGDGLLIDTTAPSVRSKGSPSSSSSSAPVEISRRKRRSRSWASEDAMFYQTDDDDDDGDGDGDAKKTMNGAVIVPPHAIVDRRRLRVRTAAYSMCAGKGRTLKGRDLRNVRNLVLQMTGFIEK
ncbi:hypothetical protein ABZP36_013509 [Zizania latifolia]